MTQVSTRRVGRLNAAFIAAMQLHCAGDDQDSSEHHNDGHHNDRSGHHNDDNRSHEVARNRHFRSRRIRQQAERMEAERTARIIEERRLGLSGLPSNERLEQLGVDLVVIARALDGKLINRTSFLSNIDQVMSGKMWAEQVNSSIARLVKFMRRRCRAMTREEAMRVLDELRTPTELSALPGNEQLAAAGIDLHRFARVLRKSQVVEKVIAQAVRRVLSGELSAATFNQVMQQLLDAEEPRCLHTNDVVLEVLGFDVDLVNKMFATDRLDGRTMRAMVHSVVTGEVSAAAFNAGFEDTLRPNRKAA